METYIHPGFYLRKQFETISPNLNILEISTQLQTSRANLSGILNGKVGVTPLMALKVEAVFGISATMILEYQASYSLIQARNELKSMKLNLRSIV